MKKTTKLLAGGLMLCASHQAAAISIQLDYSYDANGFFNTALKKEALNSAASYFQTRINDSLDAINSGVGGTFNARFTNPATGAVSTISDFSVAADTLVVFAGGRALPGSTIGQGGSGGYSASGTQTFFDSISSRGEGNGDEASVNGASAFDFAPWGGSIAFDTSTSWYFDSDVTTVESFSGNDFYSVAIHELAHLLGFGASDSWDNQISGSNEFTGAASVAVNGGNIALTSGGSHWQDGTLSLVDGVSQETAMDPSIFSGSRKYFTDLDLAGLQDVGWEIAAVPVPAALFLFASALFGLTGLKRKSPNTSWLSF